MAGTAADPDTDTSSSSSSDSSSSDDDGDAPIAGALRRSYLKFAVSQDWQNQSVLSASQFAKLDLYQIDALRDDYEDPFGTKREMQGATRHFPCHVFWSKLLQPGKYSVWGRRTVGEGEQEAVIAMLETQRSEREEYLRLKEERRWKLETERKMQEFKMAKSEQLAAARSDARRASEVRAQPASAPPNRSQTRRIASIVNRIVRRNDSEDLTEEQTASLVNKGLKRLGIAALAVGSVALSSALVYFQWLQENGEEERPIEVVAPLAWSGGGFMHAGGGMFPPTIRAARIDDRTASVTDRVFAAHEARLARKSVRN